MFQIMENFHRFSLIKQAICLKSERSYKTWFRGSIRKYETQTEWMIAWWSVNWVFLFELQLTFFHFYFWQLVQLAEFDVLRDIDIILELNDLGDW